MIRFGRVKIGACCIAFATSVLTLHVLSQLPIHFVSRESGPNLDNWKIKSPPVSSHLAVDDKNGRMTFSDVSDATTPNTNAIAASTYTPVQHVQTSVAPPADLVSTATLYRPRFKFLKEPTSVFQRTCDESGCPGYKNATWTIVNFIKSSAKNFERRELLRRTWASLSYVGGGRFSTVFVIGRADGRTATLLAEEQERYDDILQFDGPDEYRNISLKTLSGMQWAVDHLADDFLYSSGDDDFLLNLGLLQEEIDESRRTVAEKKWPEFPLICTFNTLVSGQPHRHNTKWYISEVEYRWPFWPKSCYGGFYTTSVSVIKQLLDVSRKTRLLHLDDVWITGVLRVKLGMPDEMVIAPKKVIAHHYVGYNGKNSEHKVSFMKNEWENVYRQFRDKTCTC